MDTLIRARPRCVPHRRPIGTDSVYAGLDQVTPGGAGIPTRFDYDIKARTTTVKNNSISLKRRRIKTSFYSHANVLRMAVSSVPLHETATECMLVDRWKLSAFQDGVLKVLKDVPTAYINIYALNLLLRADIYGIVRQFMEGPYQENELPGTASCVSRGSPARSTFSGTP
ncbi:MAG: hypothetical protein ACLUES_08715 [Flavonifractor plautii]